MKTARINAMYECTIDVIQEGIADDFRKKLYNWNSEDKNNSPFRDWAEPMNIWYAEPSGIYVAIFADESRIDKKRKSDTIILHVCSNVPMWCMADEIKGLLTRLGVENPKLQSPNYIRAVAQSALKLMEIDSQ